jgi:hypothetical protein
MSGFHTVKHGENLSSIARLYGLATWRAIYDHPTNAAFRRSHPDPNLIFPGDRVFIPGAVAGAKALQPDLQYSADDPAFDVGPLKDVEPDTVFEIRPPRIPPGVIPLYDEEVGGIVGYQTEGSVYAIYDLDGKLAAMVEPGLESPLIDPIDLLVGASLVRALGRQTVKAGTRAIVAAGGRAAARPIAAGIATALRSVVRSICARNLKFTATAASRMATQGRHVPVQILQLGIRYGTRVADPQGVRGAFMYSTKMFRNGVEYTLEIVVRERDWTILHFLYK